MTMRYVLAALFVVAVAVGPAIARDIPAKPDVCCKVCTKGLACGNSCISRTKQCHKPPGCACQAGK